MRVALAFLGRVGKLASACSGSSDYSLRVVRVGGRPIGSQERIQAGIPIASSSHQRCLWSTGRIVWHLLITLIGEDLRFKLVVPSTLSRISIGFPHPPSRITR